MTLRTRDKRALMLLGAAAALFLILNYAIPTNTAPSPVRAPSDIPAAEARLTRLRQLAAAVPGKEQVLKSVAAELEQREKAMIQSETAAQAQAQLLQTLRRIAKAQTPPLDFRAYELGQIRPFGDDYGDVQVSVTVDCRIEELLNLLAELTAQPELTALSDLRVSQANAKEKTVSARITVSGVVPRRLVPEKKGLPRF